MDLGWVQDNDGSPYCPDVIHPDPAEYKARSKLCATDIHNSGAGVEFRTRSVDEMFRTLGSVGQTPNISDGGSNNGDIL
jgi:hypothetical protein